MIWVILSLILGVALGALLSRPLLRATSAKGAWASKSPPETAGAVVAGVLVLLGIGALFLSFGLWAGAMGALLAAIGGVAWSVAKQSSGMRPWLRAAQGMTAGVVATPLLLGLALSIATLGGPFSGDPTFWNELVGSRAFPAWAACVRSGGDESGQAAVALVRSSGLPAVKVLLSGTRSSFGPVRAASAAGLGTARGAGVFERLIELLQDSDPNARKAAADLLKQLRDPRALLPLYRAAGKDGNKTVVENTADIPGSLQAATDCLGGQGECAGDETARFGAGLSLEQFKQGNPSLALIKGMQDKSARIRKQSAETAYNLVQGWERENGIFITSMLTSASVTKPSTTTAVDGNRLMVALADLTNDPDRQVRKSVLGYLSIVLKGSAMWGGKDGPSLRDPDSRFPALPAARITAPLLKAMRDVDPQTRGFAADALAGLGDRRAIPVLQEVCGKLGDSRFCPYCMALEDLGVTPVAHPRREEPLNQ